MDGRTIKISVDVVQGQTSGKKAVADLEKEVLASQKRVEANSKKTAQAIANNQKAIDREMARESKAKANEFLRTLKTMEDGSKKAASNIQSSFSSAFKGGFLGGLTGVIASQLSALPGMVRQTLDEVVSIAAERQNALKGLESASLFKGIDPKSAQEAVQGLRLVKGGVIDVSDAITGLKNLLLSGFSLPQSIQLLERFSDSAAFGKQAALSYGDAIKSATEGIKNQNSVLVDNAGVTKNISVMLKEAGFEMEDLSDKVKGQNALLALYNGLIGETNSQVGNADKLMQGWTGTVAALETAKKNLYATIGDVITRNVELRAAIMTLTGSTRDLTTELQDNDSQTRATFNSWISWTGKATVAVTNFVDEAKADISAFQGLLASLVLGMASQTMRMISYIPMGINKGVIEPVNAVIRMAKDHPWLFRAMTGGDSSQFGEIPLLPTGEDMASQLGRQAAVVLRESQYTFSAAKQRSNTRWIRYQENIDALNNAGNAPGSPAPRPSATPNSVTGTLAGGGSGSGGSGRGGGGKASELPAFGSMRELVISSGNTQWDAWFVEMGRKFNVDPNVLLLQAKKESSFNKNAKSHAGAQGFSQFMPATAKRFGVNVNSVQDSIRGQAEYMASLLSMFGGDYSKALAGYNAGEGNVKKYGGIPPFAETRDYVAKIKSQYMGRVRKKSGAYGTYDPGIDDSGVIDLGKQEVFGSDSLNLRDTSELREMANLYGELADQIFMLTERTHEEIAAREVLIGKYKDLNPELKEAIVNTARLRDEDEAAKELDAISKRMRENLKRYQEDQTEDAKRAAEEMRDAQIRAFDESTDFFRNKLDTLFNGGPKALWQSILDSFKRQFIDRASQMLAGLFGGMNQGGGGGQRGGGIGNIFGSIFGGGGGIGPGGTAPFNPGSNFTQTQGGGGFNFGSFFPGSNSTFGGGSVSTSTPISNQQVMDWVSGGTGGGWLSGLGMGPRKNLLSGKMSKVGGIMGGIGDLAAIAGGMIGGRAGRAMQYGGMGMSIGSMFGPWGAAIGGGIGALVGLFSRDNATKKLKEAALTTYGITVKDKSVLESIKRIGEAYFGKGQVGKNADQIIRLEESRDILMNYAEATGQNTNKLNAENFSNPDWRGNQFSNSYRASGPTAGRLVPASGGSAGVGIGMSVGGGSTAQLQIVVGQLEETIHQLASRIESLPAGEILALGAKERPEVVTSATREAMTRDPRVVTDSYRYDGRMI